MTLEMILVMDGDNELLSRALGPGPECPPFRDLASGVKAGLPAALEHVRQCPHCADELKLYRQFVEGAVEPGERDDVRWIVRQLKDPSRPAKFAKPAWAGSWWDIRTLIQATLAIAAAITFVNSGIGWRTAAGPLSSAPDAVERSQSVGLLAPKGEVAAAPESFRWDAVASAASYRVRLMEVDKTVLWESSVTSTSVPLPPQMQRRVLPGKRFIWVVEALNASGQILATGTQDFRRQVHHDK